MPGKYIDREEGLAIHFNSNINFGQFGKRKKKNFYVFAIETCDLSRIYVTFPNMDIIVDGVWLCTV
jgi:hypothetical protein